MRQWKRPSTANEGPVQLMEPAYINFSKTGDFSGD